MKEPSSNQEQQNSTFILEENNTQLAWLFNLDANLTRAMGGLFPERDGDIAGIHDILDLACGAGGWALEIAHTYPHVPDGHHIGIVPHLARLLHETGFMHIRNRASTPEISPQTPHFGIWREQDAYAWQLVEPFLVRAGVATLAEVQELRAEALKGFMSENFCAIAFYFTCWGEKPQ